MHRRAPAPTCRRVHGGVHGARLAVAHRCATFARVWLETRSGPTGGGREGGRSARRATGLGTGWASRLHVYGPKGRQHRRDLNMRSTHSSRAWRSRRKASGWSRSPCMLGDRSAPASPSTSASSRMLGEAGARATARRRPRALGFPCTSHPPRRSVRRSQRAAPCSRYGADPERTAPVSSRALRTTHDVAPTRRRSTRTSTCVRSLVLRGRGARERRAVGRDPRWSRRETREIEEG